MSLLDKLVSFFKEGSNAASTLDYLHKAFAPLEKFDSNYPDRAVEYVMSGNEATLLMELNGKPDGEGSYLLGRPARFLKYCYYDDNKQARQAQIARSHLYADLFGRLTNEQIVRFGKLLQAATKGDEGYDFIHTAPLAPVWFLYLMIDCYVLPERGANLPEDKKHRWTADQLLDLLRSEGVEQPEKVLIQTLFEREGVSKYDWGNGNDLFRKPEGIFEFLQAHPVELYEMVIAMSEGGQWVFIEKFGKDNAEILNSQPKLVVALCASGSKQVRKAAEAAAGSLKAEEAREYLAALLANGTPKQRSTAADLLARGGEGSRSTLAAALETEKSKSVRESIRAALNRLDSMAEADDTEYAPQPFEPLVQTDIPDSILPVLEQNARELTEKKRQAAEREIEENKTADYKSTWAQNEYKQWQKHYNDEVPAELLRWINAYAQGCRMNKAEAQERIENGGYVFLREILTYKRTLQNLPEYGLHHALRLESGYYDYIDFDHLFLYGLQVWHFEHLDLRQLAQAAVDIGVVREKVERDIAEAYLRGLYYARSLPEFVSRPELVIPFFMEHSDFIDEALGMIPSRSENELCKLQADKAIAMLAKFPAIPKAYIPKLLEIALGSSKTARQDAQNLLQTLPNIHQRAIEALSSGKQDIRIVAVEWLGRLGNKEAVEPLYDLLKKEKKETVVAAILNALEALGEDISAYLTPKSLLADAEKGLKGKLSASFTWFDFGLIPAAKWADGSPVDPQILQWWLVLAEKLKDPNPNPLFQRYMTLLDEKSRQDFSLFVMQSFIAQDTKNCGIDEATEYAVKEAPGRLKDYQRWFKQYPEYYPELADITLEQVVERIKREKLGEYLGSAIKSKGMLALAGDAQGAAAVKVLQDFLKNHFLRRAQIEALLCAVSASNDPLIIQLLLSLSRRYRTASVQELAKTLVTRIAERNHWTADELADRTIPTAGLDENGILTLEYGSRTLSAYVDDADKFVLKNEEGKTIKALPAPRQSDDAALVKEAKSQFANAKKEHKQVVQMQTARLYEAMCAERTWSAADWLEYLAAHPIMKRLIARMVWIELDAEGFVLQTFRPDGSGSLLNLDDDEIELQSDSFVKPAHRVLMGEADAESWQAHLKDYKVKPLFDQLSNELPEFDEKADAIDNRKGWLTDTYTLRGVLTKMGYQRASIEDGGSFDRYFKPYDALGISAVIEFSGSYVPEENIPAVLYSLSFDKQRASSWNDTRHLLGAVPPVLLAESYADYLKTAEACSGYDPEWEKKTPW